VLGRCGPGDQLDAGVHGSSSTAGAAAAPRGR
jgi:hypothetical protein